MYNSLPLKLVGAVMGVSGQVTLLRASCCISDFQFPSVPQSSLHEMGNSESHV